MLVGRVVGVAVGRSVGVAVGRSVGVAVGLRVGVIVGLIVGVAVGLRVGVMVGRVVGVAVGPRVGDRVGREVGVGEMADVPDVDSEGVGVAVVTPVVVSDDVESEGSVWLAEVESVGSDVSGPVVVAVSLVPVVAAVVVAVVVEMLDVMSAGLSWQAVRAISRNVKIVRRMTKPFLASPARLNLRISLIRALANGLPQLS